jgi:hypothetical protein
MRAKKPLERKIIRERLGESLWSTDFEGPIDQTVDFLLAIRDWYPSHANLQIEFDQSYDGIDAIWIWGERPETDAEFERRKDKAIADARRRQTTKDNDVLVGVAEIAGLAKVSVQAVSNWQAPYNSFPKPRAQLQCGPVWSKLAIERWLRQHKPLVRNAQNQEGR